MGTIGDYVNQAKAWWKSKAITGVIITYLPMLLLAFGVKLDLESIQSGLFESVDLIANALDNIWVILLSTYGAIRGIYGRVVAKSGITNLFKSKSIPGDGIK